MVIVMNKEKRIPEIRFAGFTDDWEQRKLGDMVEFFSGLTYSPHNVVEKPGTLVLRSSNVQNGEIVTADNVYVKNEVVNSDNVQVGDIAVVVRNGSKRLIGKHAVIKSPMKDTVIGAFMTGVRSDIPGFTNALLDSKQFEIEIEKNLGATINQITTGNFKKMTFNFPKVDEMLKLGELFNQLDNIIALHQQLLTDYKQFKKAMLQQLFPQKGESVPKIRFTGFNEDWKKERLSKYLNEISDKSTVENQHTILSSTTTGIEIRDGRVSGVSNLGYKIIKKGNVVLSPQNLWMGNINYNKEFEIGLVSPSYKTFSVENAEECFLVYYLKLPKMIYSYGQASVQGASVVRRNLDIDLFNQIVVLMPNREEQEKIGNFFKQLDETIEGHEQKLAIYQELKKALLQRMFV